jgi:hypothetical protein
MIQILEIMMKFLLKMNEKVNFLMSIKLYYFGLQLWFYILI